MNVDELDLSEVLTHQPNGCLTRLLGHRALILDTVAMGLLRKELITTVGEFAARGILTRFGYAHGWRWAETLKEEHPEFWKDKRAGALMHQLTGQVSIEAHFHSDDESAKCLVESNWIDSYEAEQHLLQIGRSDTPVCWTLAGWASGFNSYRSGKEIYFVEDRCVGMGDPICHVTARTRENWGPEADRFLAYYHADSVDAMLQQLTEKLHRMDRKIQLRREELAMLEARDEDPSGVVVRSEVMRQTLARARRIARSAASTVIVGESGVGKEVFARIIHAESSRASEPFITVNCGAIAETLLERELFGHARGAFTGADREAVGLFEAATGGTLFLDEIGEVSPAMQVKLLRVLEAKEVLRVGDTRPRPVDVRVVAATNRDLMAEVSAGRFRRDLYYRLSVIGLQIPPLRERTQDIVPLARTFLRRFTLDSRARVAGLTTRAVKRLESYPWPGNVRELRNAMEYAVALCSGEQIDLEDLPDSVRLAFPEPAPAGGVRPLHEVERDAILHALEAAGGNRMRAAATLQISPATLYRRLKELREGGAE